MRKIKFMGAIALALFGVADASFAVDPNHIATNEQIDTRNNGRPALEAFRDVAQEVNELSQQRGARVPNEMRTDLIDKFRAFLMGLEQNINKEIQNIKIPKKMRTDLNDKFRAFLKDWQQEREGVRFSEGYCSADLFKQIVSYPVLDATDEDIYENIFNMSCEEGRTDILMYCILSVNFNDYFCPRQPKYDPDYYIDQEKSDRLAKCLEFLYRRACNVLQSSGDQSARRKAEDRAIQALYLPETRFSMVTRYICEPDRYEPSPDSPSLDSLEELREIAEPDILEPGSYTFLKLKPGQELPLKGLLTKFRYSQLYYIVKGELRLKLLENPNDIAEEEKLWQNADLGCVLDNLDRMRGLGLTIPDFVASRMLESNNTRFIVNDLIRDYIEDRKTVLPDSFLNKLYDFEEENPRATIDQRNLHVANKGVCILEPEMVATFVKYHKKKEDWFYEEFGSDEESGSLESLEDEESGSLESLEDEENGSLTPLEENRNDESRQESMKSRKCSQDKLDELYRQVHNPKQARPDSEDGSQAYKRRRLD